MEHLNEHVFVQPRILIKMSIFPKHKSKRIAQGATADDGNRVASAMLKPWKRLVRISG